MKLEVKQCNTAQSVHFMLFYGVYLVQGFTIFEKFSWYFTTTAYNKLALFTHSNHRINQTGPSIPSMVNLSLFFVLGGNQTACEEFSQLAFLDVFIIVLLTLVYFVMQINYI
jgi:hypothetical protein